MTRIVTQNIVIVSYRDVGLDSNTAKHFRVFVLFSPPGFHQDLRSAEPNSGVAATGLPAHHQQPRTLRHTEPALQSAHAACLTVALCVLGDLAGLHSHSHWQTELLIGVSSPLSYFFSRHLSELWLLHARPGPENR